MFLKGFVSLVLLLGHCANNNQQIITYELTSNPTCKLCSNISYLYEPGIFLKNIPIILSGICHLILLQLWCSAKAFLSGQENISWRVQSSEFPLTHACKRWYSIPAAMKDVRMPASFEPSKTKKIRILEKYARYILTNDITDFWHFLVWLWY